MRAVFIPMSMFMHILSSAKTYRSALRSGCNCLLVAAAMSGSPAHAQVAGQSKAPAPAASAPLDYARELRTLTPMAQQGHAVAQFNLGVMHDFGQGVPKDAAQAVRWYRLAAAQGHGGAQYNLAGMYYEGLGVPRDLVRASMWFALSAQAGVPGASKNRAIVTRSLTPAQREQAQNLARDCLQGKFQGCD